MSLVVIVITLSGLISLFVDGSETMGKVKGPYVTQLRSAHKCASTKPPYLTKTLPKIEVELYNTSTKINLVRVNISAQHNYSNLMFKIKLYIWEDGKWKYSFMIRGDDCRGPMGVFFKAMAISDSVRQCSVPKGEYFLNDIDANILDHTVTLSKKYGRSLSRIEVYMKTGTLFCYEYESLIMPA